MHFCSRIDNLLKQCADGYSTLQDQKTTLASTSAVHQLIIQDLQLGMQRLIQLRNVLDASPQVAQDEMWSENTKMVLDQVQKQLHHALHVGWDVPARHHGLSTTPMMISSSSSSSSSTSSSSSLSTSPDDLMLTTDIPIPNPAMLPHKDFRQRKASDHQLPAKQCLRMLFRGKDASPLLPTCSEIDLFRQDEDDASVADMFASDAIVDQPLRIGVGYGSYVCYSCTVLSDKGPAISIRKRYSDFVDLRQSLLKNYPHLKNSIPKLPPKRVVGKFTPAFVERRRRDLEYFFKYVVLHPTLGSSTLVTHWIAP